MLNKGKYFLIFIHKHQSASQSSSILKHHALLNISQQQ